MGHYAFIDENNIVTEVIVGKDEGSDGIDWEIWYGNFRGQRCVRTSYNTAGGVHLLNGIPFRKNYAGIGYTYDETLDAFIPPKPDMFPSFVVNPDTCLWEPPLPKPEGAYMWDEENVQWVLVEPPTTGEENV